MAINMKNNSSSTSPSYRKHAMILGISISIVLCVSLLALVLLPRMQKSDALTARIYQDGRLLHTIDLNAVTENYTLTVTSPSGQYNIIEVRPGSIGITEANCPDKLCVHMGFQSSSLFPIICLPNKLTIEINRDGDTTENGTGDMAPDGVAY